MTKKFIYISIFLACLSTFIFTAELWEITFELNKPSDYAYIIAAQAGLIGGVLMCFQYVLGIRAFTSLFTKDILSILDVHKNIGIYAMLVIFLHPLLMVLFYLSNGIHLINLNFNTSFEIAVKLGTTAFSFFLIIWLSSAILRTRLGFRSWKVLHFISYLIFPFVFIHALQIGYTVQFTDYKYIWYLLGAIYLLLTIYRIIFQFGFKKYKYVVKEITEEANGIKRIILQPKDNFIKKVIPGQFAYLTIKGFFRESHPFTIADFNEENYEMTFVIKQLGKWTQNLNQFYVDQEVIVDGPYGIFLKDSFKYDSVFFYAGGIGVTPFLRTTRKLLAAGIKVTFFYSVRFKGDIAYKKELDEYAENYKDLFELIYVVADEKGNPISPHKTFLGRRIDKEIMTSTREERVDSLHAICGPKPFMNAVKQILKDDGIKKEHIDMELFGY